MLSPLDHDWLDPILPWLVLAWISGVLVLSLRAWRQWRNLQMLVHMADKLPIWQQHINEMAARYGIRRHVTVLRSRLMVTPGVVGWLRPVILLPMAVACSFPATQIELVLAHELAHLRRWDPLANLFQVALETLYFFHPVVGWISRDVRNEREICCDAMALTMTNGSRRELGNALMALGELRQCDGALFLAASGGVLLDRVQFMLQPARQGRFGQTSARFVAVLLGGLLIALAVRLEWSQRQLQQGLTESLTQWRTKLVADVLFTMAPSFALHIGDLAPLRMHAARPPAVQLPRISVKGGDPVVMSAIAGWRFQSPGRSTLLDIADEHPHLAPLKSEAEKDNSLSMQPVPILVRPPVYPRDALARGVQGRVVIEFSLTPEGLVRNPRIISANPAGVFNMAALQAIDGGNTRCHRAYRGNANIVRPWPSRSVRWVTTAVQRSSPVT
jgi:TonB family C-terminal domain